MGRLQTGSPLRPPSRRARCFSRLNAANLGCYFTFQWRRSQWSRNFFGIHNPRICSCTKVGNPRGLFGKPPVNEVQPKTRSSSPSRARSAQAFSAAAHFRASSPAAISHKRCAAPSQVGLVGQGNSRCRAYAQCVGWVRGLLAASSSSEGGIKILLGRCSGRRC